MRWPHVAHATPRDERAERPARRERRTDTLAEKGERILTLPRLKPGDSRRTLMATHYVSPRRFCPNRLGVADSEAAWLAKALVIVWRHVQRTLLLVPVGTIYHGT